MQRNDSASVISSLQMDYGDSDEDESDSRNNSTLEAEEDPLIKTEVKEEPPNEEKGEEIIKPFVQEPLPEQEANFSTEQVKEEPEVSPVDFISDDDDDNHSDSKHHHRHHHHSHHHHHRHDTNSSRDDNIPGKEGAVREAVAQDSPASQDSSKPEKKARRLVSYGPDEDLEDEDSSEDEHVVMQEGHVDSPVLNASDASILSRSVQNMANDDIQIPPEPPGKCPFALQKSIEVSYEKMRRDGFDLNRVIQTKKMFRNPSIYEKLIDFCHIDEKGTNFPVEIYDPHIWGKESFYDELDKGQRKDMERREKEKKDRTKIEFMVGTKKVCSANDGAPEEKKRKTKWDAQPGNIQVQFSKLPSASQNPGVANLTAIATGTKATVIPAMGSLSKKSSAGK